MSDLIIDLLAPKTKLNLKVGLYFGSFNPIHIGHMAIANYMVEFTPIDQLWFVVSPQNPFKKKANLLDDYQRLEMAHRAVEGDNRLRASNIEFKLAKPSYTIDTLIHLEESYPDYQFSIIMGADNLENFHKWKNYETILSNHKIIVYPRPGYLKSIFRPHKNITIAEGVPLMEISSSFIRKSIKTGKDMRHFIPQNAWEYLEEMNFYKK